MQEEFTFNPLLPKQPLGYGYLTTPTFSQEALTQESLSTPVKELMKTKQLNFHIQCQKASREKKFEANRERVLLQSLSVMKISENEHKDHELWTNHKIDQIAEDDPEEFYQSSYEAYEDDCKKLAQYYEDFFHNNLKDEAQS